ncbi:MAG: glycoside hydrolase family 3 protein [Spirochaetaceae bacterium]|nr:glycoside hydrolase family 3 protein [Spirochaetaceae bacterium]
MKKQHIPLAALSLAAFLSTAAAVPYSTKTRISGAVLTGSELAAQVIMTGVDARGLLSEGEKRRLRAVPAGAVMLFKKNLDVSPAEIKKMNAEMSAIIEGACGVKPFIAVDHEGGTVHRFGEGVPRLPAPADYRALAFREGEDAALLRIRQDAASSAKILSALGITMNLAPVAEPLTAENFAFLGTRSYGEDTVFTGKAALAFVRGMNGGGITCVLKHFPGNTGVDPHRAKPEWNIGEAELYRLTSPFRAIWAEQPRAPVMVAHTVVSAWDAETNASLSPKVMRMLRGFCAGIILADDFTMGAAGGKSPEECAVLSLIAGADMVMAWPSSLAAVHSAILRAMETGRLPRSRIEDAVRRIMQTKGYN